ncbi:sperm-associated antigen 1-like [Dendronephthya gigantea]|uniref:sperm-associated antigen 1-like n=1 Tax=Dendronephthya gigantea TaxID=151771 RepID=UPI00106A7161|nr:sperm-associated antigen 1-like [Dendronephthya gigantea]
MNKPIPGSLAKANGTNIPIGHLDYSYIKDCNDAKELEEIIGVLRTGKEGYYPELVEFAEKKLKELNPKSEILRKDKPAPTVKDLNADEQKSLTEDFQEWIEQANDIDKKLRESNGQAEETNVDGLIPVRSKKTIVSGSDTKNAEKPTTESKKRVKPRDYNEWDKLNVDEELKNVDKKQEGPKPKVAQTKSSMNGPAVSTKDMNAEERLLRATKEKEKGNEAFRAQDYSEAVIYYTTSLKYEPTAASYNNRAAAELKIERFSEAIEDCCKVLEIEPKNLKALIRRGIAYKALKQYELAAKDFNLILSIDPKNKRAKDLLGEIQATKKSNNVQTQTETRNVDSNKTQNVDQDISGAKRKKKRLNIVEIDSSTKDTECGNAQNRKSGLSNHVGENSLEATSKGTLDDMEVKSGVKHEQVGLSKDNSKDSATENKRNLAGVDCCLVMESETEVEAEPGNQSSDGNLESPSGTGNEEPVQNGVESVLELPIEVKELMKDGNDFYKMGHHAEALKKFSNCVEHLWEDRESYTSAVSSLLNNKAACYFKMGDCKQCVVECNESLKLIDDNIKTLLRRGTAFETMEKYAEAFRDFNRVRLIDATNKMAQEHCSRVIKHLEMLHGKSWRKEIFEMSGDDDSKQQIFPDVGKSVKNSNQVQQSKKEDEDSKMPEEVSPLPDNSPNAGKAGVLGASKEESGANVMATFLKLKETGNALVKKGKHEEAIKSYTDCIKLCPEEVAIYTNRALCYLQLTKYDLAEADCNTALKIQSENIKAFFRRGKARKGLGRYREASEDLVQVLKLDSKNGAARSELTNVLTLLKKEKKEEDKSVPKRKKILIQDVDDDEKNKPDISAPQEPSNLPAKKNETLKTVQKRSPPESNQKPNKTKTANSKVSQKENAKKKIEDMTAKASVSAPGPVKYNVKTAYQFLQSWKSVKSEDAWNT